MPVKVAGSPPNGPVEVNTLDEFRELVTLLAEIADRTPMPKKDKTRIGECCTRLSRLGL